MYEGNVRKEKIRYSTVGVTDVTVTVHDNHWRIRRGTRDRFPTTLGFEITVHNLKDQNEF